MSASQYPVGNDDSFNSFKIGSNILVQAELGRTYTQNELVPISQVKFFETNSGTASVCPIPMLSIPCKPSTTSSLQDEAANSTIGLAGIIGGTNIFNIYQSLLTNAPGYAQRVDVVLCIVTPLANSVVCSFPTNIPNVALYTLFLNYRLTWFVPQNSFYAQ